MRQIHRSTCLQAPPISPVGVPGLLLGGGVSYFANRRGWAADHVLNYEIVTADGQVLNVNAQSNSDLFWALKGAGQSNYGIVTRFDLEVFPIGNVYAGFIIQAPAFVKQLVQAVASYVAVGGGSLDPNVAVVPTLEFAADARTTTGLSRALYNSSSDPAPKALENFTSIPVAGPSTVSERSLPSYINETIAAGTRGSRQLFRGGSLKSTPEAVHLIADTYNSLVPTLKNISGCLVTLSFQELSQSFVQATHDNGPDAIGLDPANGAIMSNSPNPFPLFTRSDPPLFLHTDIIQPTSPPHPTKTPPTTLTSPTSSPSSSTKSNRPLKPKIYITPSYTSTTPARVKSHWNCTAAGKAWRV